MKKSLLYFSLILLPVSCLADGKRIPSSKNSSEVAQIRIQMTVESPCDVKACGAGGALQEDLTKKIEAVCEALYPVGTVKAVFTKSDVTDIHWNDDDGANVRSHRIDFLANCK